jgi:hypothetical protein
LANDLASISYVLGAVMPTNYFPLIPKFLASRLGNGLSTAERPAIALGSGASIRQPSNFRLNLNYSLMSNQLRNVSMLYMNMTPAVPFQKQVNLTSCRFWPTTSRLMMKRSASCVMFFQLLRLLGLF